jgi:hypothetical protein
VRVCERGKFPSAPDEPLDRNAVASVHPTVGKNSNIDELSAQTPSLDESTPKPTRQRFIRR